MNTIGRDVSHVDQTRQDIADSSDTMMSPAPDFVQILEGDTKVSVSGLDDEDVGH